MALSNHDGQKRSKTTHEQHVSIKQRVIQGGSDLSPYPLISNTPQGAATRVCVGYVLFLERIFPHFFTIHRQQFTQISGPRLCLSQQAKTNGEACLYLVPGVQGRASRGPIFLAGGGIPARIRVLMKKHWAPMR